MEALSIDALRSFAKEFAAFPEEYAVIGGAACHLWFASRAADFRRTQDVDLVLLVKSESRPFLHALLRFLERHRYRAETVRLDDGASKARLYRFINPADTDYPMQIELLGPDDDTLHHALGQRAIPVKTGGEYSGLSCILLNNSYFQLLREHHRQIAGISAADENVLVAYKMKAYLNIMAARNAGNEHGSDYSRKNADKHRNDAVRLLLEGRVETLPVPRDVHDDILRFVDLLQNDAGIRHSLQESFRVLHPQLNVNPELLDGLASIILETFPLKG